MSQDGLLLKRSLKEKIRDHLIVKGWVSLTDLHKLCSRHLSADELRDILMELNVSTREERTRGRTKMMVRL